MSSWRHTLNCNSTSKERCQKLHADKNKEIPFVPLQDQDAYIMILRRKRRKATLGFTREAEESILFPNQIYH